MVRYTFVWIILFLSTGLTGQQIASGGMVVSDHVLASEVGVNILKQGGNAMDAAVATAFALAVTHPQAGNIGGGGFLVFMDTTGKATTIDFRETAPLAATPEMFMDDDGNIKTVRNHYGSVTTANHTGLLSVGVPGTVAGLWMAHRKYGKLPWKQLVEPAIQLAEEGFPLSPTLAQHARSFSSDSRSSFLQDFFRNDDGTLVQEGETWKQPMLGNTLEQIRDKGRDGFYRGPVAGKIAAYMKQNGGMITEEDLLRYEAIEREPVKGSYSDFIIYSMPPPSSGGVALIQMMHMMECAYHPEKYRGGKDTMLPGTENPEFNTPGYMHLLAEVMRRAYADRAAFMGDPDFNPAMPTDQLVSREYAEKRFSDIDMNHASKSDPGTIGQLPEGPNTTHISVIDGEMNAVALTYTLEFSYGSGLGVPELGFIFNNEMGDFNPVPGLTNKEGLIGTAPNTIQPGKRMLSSMTPTIVARDGIPYLVIGSPGGRTIINTVFQTVLSVLEFDMPVDKAIGAVKIHHQWLPDVIVYEEDLLSPDILKALEEMGHTMVPRSNLGRLMGIQVDAENGTFRGAADASSPDGAAVGYPEEMNH